MVDDRLLSARGWARHVNVCGHFWLAWMLPASAARIGLHVSTDSRPVPDPAAGSQRARHHVLRALALLAVLPLPVAALALCFVAPPQPPAGGDAQQMWTSQVLLALVALVVSTVGGLLIWRTAMSLATEDVASPTAPLDQALAARLEDNAPLKNSFTRMLATIEQQTEEISHFAQRLDSAYQDLESAHIRLQEVTFTDEVTRLYNRRFFSIRLEEELARHRRF